MATIVGGPVIEARGLVKRYGSLTAVDGVSFSVESGEIFGLLGPNGAGKTTTLEMLEGLRKADSGDATVLGESVVRRPRRIKQRIGVQLQATALPPKTKVFEAIDLFGAFYDRRLPTSQLLSDLDLTDKASDFAESHSGGQVQRLETASRRSGLTCWSCWLGQSDLWPSRQSASAGSKGSCHPVAERVHDQEQ
jgi:ABC-2 type transport system ATP-binding protein